MFYSSLKEIIAHIEKTVGCPQCGASLQGQSIEVMYIHGSKVALVAHCEKCGASATVVVSEEAPKARSLTVRKKEDLKAKISINDVLDLQTYIRNFSGSFKDTIK